MLLLIKTPGGDIKSSNIMRIIITESGEMISYEKGAEIMIKMKSAKFLLD